MNWLALPTLPDKVWIVLILINHSVHLTIAIPTNKGPSLLHLLCSSAVASSPGSQATGLDIPKTIHSRITGAYESIDILSS